MEKITLGFNDFLKKHLLLLNVLCFILLVNGSFAQPSAWTQLFPTGTSPTTGEPYTTVYDTTHNQTIAFGGMYSTSQSAYLNQLAVLNNANGREGTSSWTRLTTLGDTPPPRDGHTAVYDENNNKMIVFGGTFLEDTAYNDVWVLDHANGIGGSPTWIKLIPTGNIPLGRFGHTAVYDVVNNRMIIFGGVYIDKTGWYWLNDVWILEHANGLGGTPVWTQFNFSGSLPKARRSHSAVYDSTHNRMIVFGGLYNFTYMNDIWVLDNANGMENNPLWREITPSGVLPVKRVAHSAVYNKNNNRMIIFGGLGLYGTGTTTLNDVWVLDMANDSSTKPVWMEIPPIADSPPPRWYHSIAYDYGNNRMMVYSGHYYNGTTQTFLNDVWVLNEPDSLAPFITNVPALKLFTGQSLLPAFNLADYNTNISATTYSAISSFLGLSSVTGAQVYQSACPLSMTGTNLFELGNSYGVSTASNKIKYSTYKIKRLPQIVLRPGSSCQVNVGNYTMDSTNNPVIPPSFHMYDSLMISDISQIDAEWSNASTMTITALSGFTSAQYVDVIASPLATAPFGLDMDKERIEIYPEQSTTAFELNNPGDTGTFSFQTPAGITTLADIGYVSAISDSAGTDSHGGVLKITFASPTSGIKITPKFSAWLHNTPRSWYILRVRVFGTNTANNYLQLLFNGVPGKSPTDVQCYFKYSLPSTWTYFDIPVNTYNSFTSAPVMYPQLILKANGSTGTIYIDEIKVFQASPPLMNSRYKTGDNYMGGLWNESNPTSYWAIQSLSGTPTLGVANGHLYINTSSAGTTRSALKFTASTASRTVYTVKANQGKQAGMHMQVQLLSGTPSMTLTQTQVNMLGTQSANSFVQGGDIAAAAEIGRISNRTLQLAFNADSPHYQVQFIVKTTGTSTIQLDNTQADIDIDNPNYGDETLFP